MTLQINLAPGDLQHAKYILPHQLETLSGQVDEVLLTVESQVPKGRFAIGWEQYREPLDRFLNNSILPKFPSRILKVDYSSEAQKNVATFFAGRGRIPEKDFRGGPFYAYFFGLFHAANDLVLHLDSDILLGGGSQRWVGEATSLLRSDPGIFITSPLPGPPHAEGILISQQVNNKLAPYTFEIAGMSTRVFLMDKSKFRDSKLRITKPGIREQCKALAEGNTNADLPERLLSAYMRHYQFKRVDFLGSGRGMWSLHPPYRTDGFYRSLPEIIRRVERGELPPEQQGFYDITDAVCDWSEAREKLRQNRWWRRLLPRQ